MPKKNKQKWEFGDFQTPYGLALSAAKVLKELNIKPGSILEPTCGEGSFILASINTFSDTRQFVGIDINKEHLERLNGQLLPRSYRKRIKIIEGDFFTFDWQQILDQLSNPLLIIGNPPWVTSSELGMLQSCNLPEKSNFQGRNGLEAITGKSNFDISEWMLLKHLDWLKKRQGAIAMLCKTAVARKILLQAWKSGYPISSSRVYKIDAFRYFGASVDACFLVIQITGEQSSNDCTVYESLESTLPSFTIGFHKGIVVADVSLFKKFENLLGADTNYNWRSGIKHDCSKVMELEKDGSAYQNGINGRVPIEDIYLYPLLKSSDIGNGKVRDIRKYVLVTQKFVGEDTSQIKTNAPKTWRYLTDNSDLIEKRSSSIYRNRPPFSIFGVGDYSFSPWKVAISGFYKNLHFKVVGPYQGKPVVFDDTINFLSCETKDEAHFLVTLLNSDIAQTFYNSMIFWADKRPITIEILKRLNLHALSIELGLEKKYLQFTHSKNVTYIKPRIGHKMPVFSKS